MGTRHTIYKNTEGFPSIVLQTQVDQRIIDQSLPQVWLLYPIL